VAPSPPALKNTRQIPEENREDRGYDIFLRMKKRRGGRKKQRAIKEKRGNFLSRGDEKNKETEGEV
jgi:hypothetical protein